MTETGIKYQFAGGAWRAVSSEASEEVAEAIDNIDLQKVLDNGNVADKDIVLTDGVDDLIDISPTEGRIIIASDSDLKTPKLTLAHFGDIDEGNRKAEIELDENGTRLDFEMSGEVKDVHFRFGDDEKFIINHEGDAEFTGKIRVQPGTETNEVVTFGQLATLEEEIEQLAPSFERGIYSISTQEVTSSSTHNGKYNLIRKNTSSDGNAARAACAEAQNLCNRIPDNDPIDCQIEYDRCIDAIPGPGTVDIYISDFSQVQQLKFSKVDVNGEDHTWDGVLIGQLIDVFNEDNDNYMVGRITAIEGTTVKTFSVDVLSSKGSASGNARIKVFSLSETGDVTNYVRKTGDTMTGQLQIRPETATSTGLVVYAGKDLLPEDDNVIFAVTNSQGASILEVHNHGRIKAGGREINYEMINDKDLVTKKYVDSLANGPAKLAWRWLGNKSSSATPDDGGFYNNGGYLRFSFKTDNSVDLGLNPFPDTSFLTSSYGPIGTIWHYDKSVNKWQLMRQLRIDGFRWNYKDHIEYKLSSSHGRSFDELIIEQPYYITIGGWF